jgi:1-deoxy-D-xylulose-5-phosphate synthase
MPALLLDTIDSPADLRRLSYEELDELAVEIRTFIVHAVSRTGGHLGSNLGAVELTLALHRVFNSPKDVLLWDTGHQAYVHKLLTGRRALFESLRQEGGLSGYPSREESEHDWVENSHASTSLSYAHGLALAHKAAGVTDRAIVAVIGDGALTGGMAYEALNNLGVSDSRVIIVVNDNGRSYAPTVSRLGESVARLRLNPSYLRNRSRMRQMVREVPVVGEHLAWGLSGAAAGLREMFEPPVFYETLGVRYSGPFDGHDVAGLERALRHAATYDDGPVVVHVLTQKGKGYPPAEQDEEKCLHDAPSFNPEIGPQANPNHAPSYTEAFTETLIKEGEVRPEVVAVTAAMPGSTGLLPFAERYPGRVIDVGIAEQHAVTAAAGMSMGGLRPVVAIYSTFLTRAFDQTTLDVGLHGQPVVFAVDRAGVTGPDGPSAHGVLDLVLLTKVPGMTVFAPSSYQELRVMLHDALDITDGPSSIRWPRTAARMVPDDEVGSGLAARLVRRGSSPTVCLIGVGKMLADAEAAAEELEASGIGTTVWDPRVVKPLDEAMLADAARHGLVITIEDGFREGGAGTGVADGVAMAAQRAGLARPPYVRVLGVPVSFVPHSADPGVLLSDLGLDAAGIVREARSLVKEAAPSNDSEMFTQKD